MQNCVYADTKENNNLQLCWVDFHQLAWKLCEVGESECKSLEVHAHTGADQTKSQVNANLHPLANSIWLGLN